MKIATDGLILTEQTIGEHDKLITVLTRSNGILRCFVRNAKNIKSRTCTASQSFCYSRLSIYTGREKYILDDADPIDMFFELRTDIEKLALAQYFCELAINIIPEGCNADPYLRLILNCLHFVAHDKRPLLMIKAIFELRLMSLAGYMPNLVCCDECKTYEADLMYFLYRDGKLLCGNCYKGESNSVLLHKGAVTAMRHSIYADFEKLFSFTVSGDSLSEFSVASERYLIYTIGKTFSSLEFYNSVKTTQ